MRMLYSSVSVLETECRRTVGELVRSEHGRSGFVWHSFKIILRERRSNRIFTIVIVILFPLSRNHKISLPLNSHYDLYAVLLRSIRISLLAILSSSPHSLQLCFVRRRKVIGKLANVTCVCVRCDAHRIRQIQTTDAIRTTGMWVDIASGDEWWFILCGA